MLDNKTKKPLAVIVGDGADKLHPIISNFIAHWDFQKPVAHFSHEMIAVAGGDGKKHHRKGKVISPNPNFVEIERRIESEDDNHDYDVFILVDQAFSETNADSGFEDFIATYAKYALVIVLSFRPEYKNSIIRRVVQASNGEVTGENFYFATDTNWAEEIATATELFIKANQDDEYAGDTAKNLMRGQQIYRSYVNAVNNEDNNETSQDVKHDERFHSKGDGKVVSITSSKGGSGKSTTAIGVSTTMAHYLSVESQLDNKMAPKIILIDFDILDGQLGFFTGHTTPNISIINSRGVHEKTIQEAIIHDDKLKIDMILAPRDPLNAKEIPLDTYTKLINSLTHDYDYVFIDTSVDYNGELIRNIIYPMSDFIIPVTETIKPSVGSITRWIKNVTGDKAKGRMGINPEKILFAYNKYLASDAFNLSHEELQEVTEGLKVATVTPFVQSYISVAVNNHDMSHMLTSDALRLSWKNICEQILGRELVDEETYASIT